MDHFILSKNQAKNYGIPNRRLIPIITDNGEFPEYLLKGKKNLRLLVALKDKDHLFLKKYIREGKANQYDLRVHSTLRHPWYVIKVGQIPDAFFHYRILQIPYLLPNDKNVQCTNNFHRIYFKNLTETEKKWIYVSIGARCRKAKSKSIFCIPACLNGL